MTIGDTIVAISSALAEAAIGIVRLSGPDAVQLADQLFRGKLPLRTAPTHTLFYGHIVNPATNEVVDEVLAVVMRAPKSYTREDIVEIHAHGGPIVLKKILNLFLLEGARLAEPGEFTKRAFLNGRIDLTQAEAVAELISAQSEAAAKAATLLLQGGLAKVIKRCQDQLLNCRAQLEASLDFSDEDINPQNAQTIVARVNEVLNTLKELEKDSRQQRLVREGIKTAIIGRPNVGKSSLLNALLQTERAIVTEIAGTTRDIVSETFNIDGYSFVLCDTAGITFSTKDKVEQLGVQKAQMLFKDADLVLLMLDISQELQPEDEFLLAESKGRKNTVLVLNKVDLPTKLNCTNLDGVMISAKTKQGVAELKKKIKETVLKEHNLGANPKLIANERQLAALIKAIKALESALTAAKEGFGEEVLSLHLRESCHSLGVITGTDVEEALLDEIFRNFCLGK